MSNMGFRGQLIKTDNFYSHHYDRINLKHFSKTELQMNTRTQGKPENRDGTGLHQNYQYENL